MILDPVHLLVGRQGGREREKERVTAREVERERERRRARERDRGRVVWHGQLALITNLLLWAFCKT